MMGHAQQAEQSSNLWMALVAAVNFSTSESPSFSLAVRPANLGIAWLRTENKLGWTGNGTIHWRKMA